MATDADNWYILEYTKGHIPKISRKYEVVFRGKFESVAAKEILAGCYRRGWSSHRRLNLGTNMTKQTMRI